MMKRDDLQTQLTTELTTVLNTLGNALDDKTLLRQVYWSNEVQKLLARIRVYEYELRTIEQRTT